MIPRALNGKVPRHVAHLNESPSHLVKELTLKLFVCSHPVGIDALTTKRTQDPNVSIHTSNGFVGIRLSFPSWQMLFRY